MRWIVLGVGTRLHRVAFADERSLVDRGWSQGGTLCGYNGCLEIPGVADRMAGRRCARCCVLVGIPPGDGAPFNVFTDDRRNL